MRKEDISFGKARTPKSGTLVFAAFEGAKLTQAGVAFNKALKGALVEAMKTARFQGKKGRVVEVLAPAGTRVERILIMGLGDPKALDVKDFEALGGRVVQRLRTAAPELVSCVLDTGKEVKLDESLCVAHAAFGARLGAYRFDKYRTKMKPEEKGEIKSLVFATRNPERARKHHAPLKALAAGVSFARDLVNEPPNMLFPNAFVKEARRMTKLGVKLEVFSQAQMKKMGMGALLGVGQGSEHESRLLVMRWQGAARTQKPLAIVGKGVCFDTGGISLKPAGNMDAMKGDMGGAACVAGLLHTLAERKARVNVVGIVGLVENMPDGRAQRPGDIVSSMSGQTIEVLNTDAEGRLVLADALWFAQTRVKPAILIDLATLTGAILVALGHDYAGLFSNDDKLADSLHKAGEREGELVWRLPMARVYDKMIVSKIADVKNIGGGRNAGSITAAQFLKRFVKKGQPWAHLDIAGTAMDSPKTPVNPSWGGGFGVRLLHRYISEAHEKR